MAHFPVLDQMILAAVVALFLWAAFTDLRSFRIPNHACLGILALYPVHLVARAHPLNWGEIGMAVAFASVVFAIGVFLFKKKVMGGGDVKLFALAVLWASPGDVRPLIFVTVLAGVVVALGVALHAASTLVTSGRPIAETAANLRFAPIMKMSVPYGVAIAAGAIYVIGAPLVV